ncbi:MAG: UDPGP type 1 family protein [Sedimentisphaerales bacterium]|nr:UDPGP type 1 family protein [Sedimentisphaerales bacterium]
MSGLKYSQAKELLEKHGQQQLLAFADRLNPDQQKNLLEQIEQLDFPKIERWIEDLVINEPKTEIKKDFTAAPYYKAEPENDKQKKLYEKAINTGKKLISAGKVAAFVVAGGQGTRLGFDGPKGNYPTSPIKNKTLFQIFAEYIAAAGKKYGKTLTWYIMTSPLNYQQTCEIFEKDDHYGLGKDNVFIFQQGTLPNFNFDGKILLADMDKIACSPDGHGGSLKALYNSGAVEHMKQRGIEYISYYQVDNPLIRIFDPLFIGLHTLGQAGMSSKALIKNDPKEKVGNFCIIDGRVNVIEYIDLPDEYAEVKNPNGSLVFELGSIAIHIISRSFVEELNDEGFSLPLHRAVKKIPYIDEEGNKIEPIKPNGIKLESFVFDALPLSEKSVIFQTLRDQEFAPVKNKTGVDSAESSRQMQIERWAGWLEKAGIKFPRKEDGSPDAIIEIAANFAIEPDDIKEKIDEIPQIKPGDTIYLE